MIAKKAPSRSDARSSFATLANYIARDDVSVRVSNCGVSNIAAAVKIVESTQQLNQRAKSDKTYHLVVSFRDGENPTDEQCYAIEDEFCRALGFVDHQRVSAIHRDTAHDHIHVAINKIHPQTLNIVDPHYDYYVIDEVCQRLEQVYGLQVDNRIDATDRERDSVKPNAKVASIEAHSGLQAFQSWVTENLTPLLPDLMRHTKDWGELHDALAEHGVQLRPRGAGLVLGDLAERGWMKASDASRALSRQSLVQRFGEYQANDRAATSSPPAEPYRPAPLHKTERLWDRFVREKNAAIAARKTGFGAMRASRDFRYAKLANRKAELHERISTTPGLTGPQKRRLYRRAAQARRNDYVQIKSDCDRKSMSLRKAHRLMTWHEFLLEDALAGNPEALNILRRRASSTPNAQNSITGQSNDSLLLSAKPTLSKTGVATYLLDDGSRVIDHGDRLDVDLKSEDSAQHVLAIARRKWGESLNLTGDDDFQRVIATAAASVDVRFDQPTAEKRRVLVAEFGAKPASQKPDTQAVSAWIDKRNRTRQRAQNMKQHTLLDNASPKGVKALAGIRQIQPNQFVALFEEQNTQIMYVLPISQRQAQRYQRTPRGTPFTVAKDFRLSQVRDER